ncbi:hypothetical protein [Chryseobacterium sp. SIMBA_029]|uniref:hypothetical protein n=1 Tax=Chryseobacterium sp. SIMBA_029 TaxID=3085772 RepID=UPI00397BD231
MPDVGRFFNIDPLAEKYQYNSTYAFQENKMGLGKELEGAELLEERGLITSTGMTEYDVYTREPLPDYMSYLNYKPSTPDPDLMTAETYPTNSTAKGAENSSSFKGVIGVVELYNVVNKGIEGVKGMIATDKNVKAINYMDKLNKQFDAIQKAQDVVNKADLKLDSKKKTEIAKYVFDGSLPKDINKRNNSVVNLVSKSNIVNTANSVMRKKWNHCS